jgi:hypothetical protein
MDGTETTPNPETKTERRLITMVGGAGGGGRTAGAVGAVLVGLALRCVGEVHLGPGRVVASENDRGAEYVSEFGVKWMSGSTERNIPKRPGTTTNAVCTVLKPPRIPKP